MHREFLVSTKIRGQVDDRVDIHGDNLNFHREYVDNERRGMHIVDDLPSQSTMNCASVVDNPAANFASQ
ncbi:ABC transporter permease, partial [Bifidobacterium breve]|nr:ABC transporter permease [Bifidobacterium breve]